MLHNAKELIGMTVRGRDGEMGKVEDLTLDAGAWTIRYLIVDTGEWLGGRRVLISPLAVSSQERDWEQVDVALSREQVLNSPNSGTGDVFSRVQEQELADYYGWTPYWAAAGPGPGSLMPGVIPPASGPAEPVSGNPPVSGNRPASGNPSAQAGAGPEEARSDLRRVRQFMGFRIEARDGEIGHIQDVLIDDQTWRINYLVIDTSNLLFGRKVIVAPTWVRQLNWSGRQVTLDLKRETVKNSPEFDAEVVK